MRILMLGLDAAGKTSRSLPPIRTVGFNVETVTYKNVEFSIWDAGGEDRIRSLWKHYYTGTQGLIFVVNSADRDRIDQARQEFHKIVNDPQMREVIILVLANKQDLPDGTCKPFVTHNKLLIYRGITMKPQEIQDKLGLSVTSLGHRNWYVQPACAITVDGLFEGLEWLMSNRKT
ncbi:unnamed protein product [Oppiella nova]|uniref:ADP-ribosylation factor n=1 Tax=Oppiella nova TaxID=334625 RepID=A0A7R9QWZ5_9ACAR|nr:unnamed protein product [Oppiella nova]CAG2178665.1 unnamed protein product [Oppiella nova]